MKKVQKMTSKGQITLPAGWRKGLGTDHISVHIKENCIEIKPVRFIENEGEVVIFNADRDNDGRGVPARDIRKALRRVNSKEDGSSRKTTTKNTSKR